LMVSNLKGTIKNVNIVLTDNPYLYQYTGSDRDYTNCCGIIAGTLQSGAVIDNVHLTVNGSISYYAEDTGKGWRKEGGYGIILGGFAGRSQGSATIRNSSVTVNGAIHGKAEDYNGNNNEGTPSRAHTGGFVGEIESGTLTMTDNALFGDSNGAIGSGAIKSESDHKSDRAGGVVGVVRSGSTLNVNGFLFDYNGVVTVFRNNSDCGLFVGKVYGSLSASNIVKSSTCTATSYENNDNTRQVTSKANVSTVASIIQDAGKVISAASVGNGSGTFSNSILYETKAYLGSTANASYGTFKISKINNGNYTARITAGSSYVPSAIEYSSTYSNCYASKPTKGSYYEISIAKTNTSYAGYVATPSYSLTASGSNKTYDGSGITYTIYPGSANAAFTNNVYINSSGGGGTTRSSAN
ncbi:MAG TPA: hypothetical protein PLA09_07615, partial [Clostridia bacterium]|nr:hypothetical protein [Clostridia bacterium]